MAIATTAALVGAGIAAAGSVAGSVISSHAAGSAADKQASAADQIRQQAIDSAKTATDTVNKATGDANTGLTDALATANSGLTDAQQKQLAALKPYIDAGQVSMKDLQDLLGTNGPLAGPQNQFSFTSKDWQNDPGFQFTKDTAEQGLTRELAARGALLGGGAIKAGARLDTGLASTHLDSAFQRAIATYDTNRQNVLTRIQGLTGLTNLGAQATAYQNQDIGNTAQLINSNTESTASRVAANKISAGEYAGQTGLRAAQIGADAISGKAAAQGAADIATGSAINNGITGVIRSISPVIYGAPKVTGNSMSLSTNDSGQGIS